MRVLLLGSMGYEGWPTLIRLLKQGHEVIGVDDGSRDRWIRTITLNTDGTLTSYKKTTDKVKMAKILGSYQHCAEDCEAYGTIKEIMDDFEPEVIINLAAQPSAPFSMLSRKNALRTQQNNTGITMNVLWAMREYAPDSVLVHASTMGEYGQPRASIPYDGMLHMNNKDYDGNPNTWMEEQMLFPQNGGSFYHISKIMDTHNILFAAKQWGLRCKILRQGVVFGLHTNDKDELYVHPTRFDVDDYFGTVLNRFVWQAIHGQPITLYGKGMQKRAFLTLEQCVNDLTSFGTLPEKGKPMIRNSVTCLLNLTDLAKTIRGVLNHHYGINVIISNVPNPRIENEDNDLTMEEPLSGVDLEDEIYTLVRRLKQ